MQDIIILNLGTPDEATVPAVRRYLREFLMDERVVDLPKPFRWLLVNLIIAPFRSPKSLNAYKKVWLRNGSPLKVYGDELVSKLQKRLDGKARVHLAMRYQNPSLQTVIKNIIDNGSDTIHVIPLFPQYASASWGSAMSKLYEEASKYWNTPAIKVVPPYFDHPEFIKLWSSRTKAALEEQKPDHVLFSFHGLPERHITKSQRGSSPFCLKNESCCAAPCKENTYCYRAHCVATATKIANSVGLENHKWDICFQSRLGVKAWIRPYTDVLLEELPKKLNTKNLLVVSPSFTADCLETVEEIGIRGLEDFQKAGGESLHLIPSLNADDDWVDFLESTLSYSFKG